MLESILFPEEQPGEADTLPCIFLLLRLFMTIHEGMGKQWSVHCLSGA